MLRMHGLLRAVAAAVLAVPVMICFYSNSKQRLNKGRQLRHSLRNSGVGRVSFWSDCTALYSAV